MTAKTIARLRSLLKRATPGPFVVHRYDQRDGSISYQVQSEFHNDHGEDLGPLEGAVLCHHSDRDSPRAKADAELHAEMRNALEDLLDEAEHRNVDAGCLCTDEVRDEPCPLHGTEK